MEWAKVYNEICMYLEKRNQSDYSEYLKEALSIGATGGEIFDIAISRLIELARKNLLDDVLDDVNAIINYAKAIEHLNESFKL